MMVYEVGKNWAEADGDTAEAIDFMEIMQEKCYVMIKVRIW